MRKFLAIVILAPLAIIIVMIAVANREVIALSFDPFDPVQPVLTVRMPMFILIFVLVGIGVLVGGTAAWLRQSKWRARARRAEADARDLRAHRHVGGSEVLDDHERQTGVLRPSRRLHEGALGVLAAGVGRRDDRDLVPMLAVEVA